MSPPLHRMISNWPISTAHPSLQHTAVDQGRRPTSHPHFRQRSTPSSSLPGGGITNMPETAAALHVLASVTQKAQRLFVLLAKTQLEAIEGHDTSGSGSGSGSGGVTVHYQATAIGYDTLFNPSRSDFIATNDTALRALLGEFRDHGLIVSGQGRLGSGGEVLLIPLRRERLSTVLQKLQAQTS